MKNMYYSKKNYSETFRTIIMIIYTYIHIAFDIKLPVVNKLHGIHHLKVFVSIDSRNGLSLFSANPLLEPMLNVCRNYPETQLTSL